MQEGREKGKMRERKKRKNPQMSSSLRKGKRNRKKKVTKTNSVQATLVIDKT